MNSSTGSEPTVTPPRRRRRLTRGLATATALAVATSVATPVATAQPPGHFPDLGSVHMAPFAPAAPPVPNPVYADLQAQPLAQPPLPALPGLPPGIDLTQAFALFAFAGAGIGALVGVLASTLSQGVNAQSSQSGSSFDSRRPPLPDPTGIPTPPHTVTVTVTPTTSTEPPTSEPTITTTTTSSEPSTSSTTTSTTVSTTATSTTTTATTTSTTVPEPADTIDDFDPLLPPEDYVYSPIPGATDYDESDLPEPSPLGEVTGSPEDVVYNQQLIEASTEMRHRIFGAISGPNDMHGTFTVPATAFTDLSPAQGMVLAFPDSPQTPGGTAVAIDSVTINEANGTVTIVTRAADIADIIEDTDGLTDLSQLVQDVRITPADGVTFTGTFDPSGQEWDFAQTDTSPFAPARGGPDGFAPAAAEAELPLANQGFTVDLKKDLSGVDAAQVRGGVEVKVKVYADIDAHPFARNHIREFRVVATNVIWGDVDFEARKAFAASLERKLAEVNASIGIGPASLNFNASIDLTASLSADASFQYQPKVNIGAVTGVEYVGGRMRPVQKRWFRANDTKPYLNGDLEFSIGARPKLEASVSALGAKFVSVYGSATGRGTFSAHVEPDTPITCGLTGQIKLDFSASAIALGSLNVGTGWMDAYRSGNLCEGMNPGDVEPTPFDPGNVVPRGTLRSYLNSNYLGVSESDAPISQAQMETLTSIEMYLGAESNLEGLQYAKNLETLTANTSHIPDLSGLTRLRRLWLKGGFDSIPAAQPFPALVDLSVHSRYLGSIPGNLVAGGKLSTVSLYGDDTGIDALPPEIGKNGQLRRLELHDTSISALPDSIGQLYSLESMSLYQNLQLKTLPASLGDLANLRELSISGGEMSLPEAIGRLAALTRLSLSIGGRLTLPESIGSLYSLQSLQIHAGVLSSLPSSFTSLRSLRYLTLGFASGASLPTDMSSMTGLQEFTYSDPSASTVPAAIGTIPNLVVLRISNSPIATLPEFLYTMTQRESGTKLQKIYLQLYRVDKSTDTYKKLEEAGVLLDSN